jgi:hypothetical protein
MTRARRIAGVAALALAVAAPAAAQTTPPSLQGEQFNALRSEMVPTLNRGELAHGFDCDARTATFAATGPAAGPYAGTYDESGAFAWVLRPNDPFGGILTIISDFGARFTIDSTEGEVVGRKTFQPDPPNLFGSQCAPGPFPDVAVLTSAGYVALIRTAEGTFVDRGTAFVWLFEQDWPGNAIDEFRESFTSTATPTPVEKQDCKDEELASLFLGGEKECKEFVKEKAAT